MYDSFLRGNELKKLLSLALFAFFFTSCIGTVEDLNPDNTKGAASAGGVLKFSGIFQAIPISNDKVEIYFYPSTEIATNITYIISYDGLKVPYFFPGETLKPDYRGLLRVVIPGLRTNTLYNFSVQAKNKEGLESNNETISAAKTFANVTADFLGIVDAKNLSGSAGRNSLEVSWVAATRAGSIILPREPDVVNYEIVILDADFATPVAFDDDSFSEPIRRVIYSRGDKISAVVTGLLEDTKYYIRVRGVHKGFIDNSSDEQYLMDSNNAYIEKQTLGGSSSLDFDQNSFLASPMSGAAGKNGLDISWGVVAGSVDHYRLYYKRTDALTSWSDFSGVRSVNCNGNEGDWSCQKIEYGQDSTRLTDLDEFTEYDIKLLICLDVQCLDNREFISEGPYKTKPSIIEYAGIVSIDQPRNFWELDQLYIQVPTISAGSDYLDGLLVQLKKREEGPSSLTDIILNHPDGTTFDIKVKPFDHLVDSEIVVTGLEPNSFYDYCFSVFPYYIDNGNVVEVIEGATETCEYTTVSLPNSDEFQGIFSATALENGLVNIAWSPPSAGVYNKYRAVLRTDGNPFLLSEAISHMDNNPGQSLYVMQELDYLDNSTNFVGLPNGEYYLGVWAYFTDTNEYSENTQIVKVTLQ